MGLFWFFFLKTQSLKEQVKSLIRRYAIYSTWWLFSYLRPQFSLGAWFASRTMQYCILGIAEVGECKIKTINRKQLGGF